VTIEVKGIEVIPESIFSKKKWDYTKSQKCSQKKKKKKKKVLLNFVYKAGSKLGIVFI